MNYTREQIAAECRALGGNVGPLPEGVDGAQLLWAIAGVESSFGADCTPRHEPAYDCGGKYATHSPMPTLLDVYGSAAAYSYGPWQVMFCNLPNGVTEGEAEEDLGEIADDSVAFLNMLLRHFRPATLAQVGEIWNAGHITPDPAYEAKLAKAYTTPMPEEVSA